MERGLHYRWWILGLVAGLVLVLGGCEQLFRPGHRAVSGGIVTGPSVVVVGQSLTYSTTSSGFCTQGHPTEFRFDWGDGTFSEWRPSDAERWDANHVWYAEGIYGVRVQVRCTIDKTLIDSSSEKVVRIIPPGGIGDTRDDGYLAFTLRDAYITPQIGETRPSTGLVFLILDLRVEALCDGQSFIPSRFRVIEPDGRLRDDLHTSPPLAPPLCSAVLDSGEWIAGKVAFEVSTGCEYYILEHRSEKGDRFVRFVFSP